MATSQTDVKVRTIELSTEAFDAFCEDISGMFGAGMQCIQQDPCDETIEGLQKRFDKLASVNSIKAEGDLDGHFQIVLGKEGLFTLAGVIVMLPEQRILSNRKQGAAKDAEEMSDSIGEAGNLLVGSWDRVFREEFEGHGHFVQTDTFIGNPWDNPKKKIGLAKDEEFLFIPYKMTIEPYPEFECGVIFPKAIFGEPEPEPEAEAATPEDENSQQGKEEPEEQPDAADQAESQETDALTEDDSEESKSQAPDEEPKAETEEAAEPTEENAESQTPDESTAEQEPKADDADTAVSENDVESESAKPAESTDDAEPVTGSVSESIQKMTQSSADLPGGSGAISVGICAKEIMQTDVIWGNPDDSVEQALAKMQQTNSSYMLVGTDGCPEGIVSTFDIAAALSIYLKPMFAKWHRPLDDATLQIKIKWIMTRPVHTITPDTSLMAIMENMCRSSLRCLPVVDEQGKAAGLVTVFDIFQALQNADSGLAAAGKTPQGPVLV